MSSQPPPKKRPRHPSAGNLGDSPEPVAPEVTSTQPPTLSYPDGAPFDSSNVRLGPGVTDLAAGRLVGNCKDKRILELGCGDGSNAIALAKQGARVIVVDSSAQRLAVARANADAHDVRIEFHHGDLADLAFVRADLIDLCLAVYSLTEVFDISRVFRQVHRVLRPEGPLVISLPHPLELMVTSSETGDGAVLTRTAFDQSPVAIDDGERHIQAHRISDLFTTLSRSNFRVDALLEPPVDVEAAGSFRTPVHDWIPATLIIRGRKQGI